MYLIHFKRICNFYYWHIDFNDADNKFSVDPHLLDSAVRKVLHQCLANKPGGSTALSKVREILQSNGVFSGKNDWNNKILSEFVCKEFVSVEIQHVQKRKARNSKKEMYPLVLTFINIYGFFES